MIDLSKNQIFYITRDIERALGIPPKTPGYTIISNSGDYGKKIAQERTDVVLIDEETAWDTAELLEHPKTKKQITEMDADVLVFKNNIRIEAICKKNGWRLLNPSAALAEKIEGKTSQAAWLDNLAALLPPCHIAACADIAYTGTPFFLQFAHSHTGEGTFLISSEEQLQKIKNTFPARMVRVSNKIAGSTYTVNAVVHGGGILTGNISYQITGMEPYTDQPFATIGNDWGLAKQLLSEIQTQKIQTMTKQIGEKMRTDGWRGLFGIDVIVEENTDNIFLIEINARQPASVTYESLLQLGDWGLATMDSHTLTTFKAHLLALQNDDLSQKSIVEINAGSRLIQRVTPTVSQMSFPKNIPLPDGCNSIRNEHNTKPGAEIAQFLCQNSVMQAHGVWSILGKKIVACLAGQQWSNETMKQLSKQAQTIISNYQSLPFPNRTVKTPYFNNKREKLRGAFRARVGKGTPQEIVDEARSIAASKRIVLDILDQGALTAFLVDHNLGIDCSGFVYHVLNAEMHARGKGTLKKYLVFPHAHGLRKWLASFRPAEHTNVQTLAHEKNSMAVSVPNIQPGDIIVMFASEKFSNPNHVLLITKTADLLLHYAHSFQWSTDGVYAHGIREGTIEITHPHKPILEQRWVEDNKEGKENETWKLANAAERVEIRRLKAI